MIVCAGAAAFALLSLTAIAPAPVTADTAIVASSTSAAELPAPAGKPGTLPSGDPAAEAQAGQAHQPGQGQTETQSISVSQAAALTVAPRDDYSASGGLSELKAGSTNRDWAKLVLYLGNFPTSDSNIEVMLRWMRQENGPDNWWNRNNPLNNGWGSGGNSGLGSYDNLVIAAENAAEALHSNPGYSAIVAGFAADGPAATVEQAIWASPWATSHYANGSHWSYSPVPVISSPAGTW
jgi:hypothetical protein